MSSVRTILSSKLRFLYSKTEMQGVADPVPEDRSESDEVPAKVRRCSEKMEWKNLEDIGGTRERAQAALTDILQKQSETVGFPQHPYQRSERVTGTAVLDPQRIMAFTQHPYQRSKRVTGTAVLDHRELWHCQHMRKYGLTLTCPFRCTS